jgi:multidrug efflux pump
MNASFTDIFIRRPVLAIVFCLLILIAGIQAISTLTVRQFPLSQNASITVTTFYIGADAELVRGFITAPLERAIASANGIDYVSSESAQNVSLITARLRLNYDSNRALAEISSKVDQIRADLPPEAEVPIINIVTADAQIAAAYLSFSSTILDSNEVTDYLVRVVQPRLTSVAGVQRADILGGRTFAMRVWLQTDRMAALGVRPTEVRAALEANNFLSAVGQTKGNLVTASLKADTDLSSVEDFEELVVRGEGDDIIRLRDVAIVELGAEDYNVTVRFLGEDAVFIGVWVLPDANTIDVIRAVRTELDSIRDDLPTGMEATFAFDSTTYIEQAINEVVKTLLETLVIVVVVIFLFMGSLRTVLVPIMAIPLSLIGAVFLMQVFGFSLNLLTLLAIVLAVGLVVDDAIVMVENVERRMREGLSARHAAILSARELVKPIVAMSITLASVYVPIGLQGGLTGSLFREFAFTLGGAVLISASVALTLSPVMSAALLKPGSEEKGLSRRINAGFNRLRSIYRHVLGFVLNSRPVIYMMWVVLALSCVPLFVLSPKELAPDEDQGVIFSIVQTPSNYSIEEVSRHAAAINDVFLSIPETDFTFQVQQPTFGFGGMLVKPWSERDRTIQEIRQEVAGGLFQVPGVSTFAALPSPLPGGGDFPVEFIISSTADVETILGFAQELQLRAIRSGLFAFPLIIDTQIDLPQAELRIDRDKVAALGLNLRQIGADLITMQSGGFVNRFSLDGRSYKVIPQATRDTRLNPEQLLDLYVSGPDGEVIPLRLIATIEERVQPRSLKRFQQLNAVKLSGVAIRPLDQALSFLEEEARSMLPQGYVLDYTGDSRQLRAEGNTFLPAFSLAVLLIFLVLAAQFNSFRDPLIILLGSVPLAIFGALWFTFLKMLDPNLPFWTDRVTTSLNIYSQVGLVTLVGLVAKNGILIVEFANNLQLRGLSKLDAVREAALTRLRPILMTSAATVFGHFPLILVTGAGAAARNSIGLVLVGGMAIGTLFTLFFIPALYMLLAKTKKPVVEEEIVDPNHR